MDQRLAELTRRIQDFALVRGIGRSTPAPPSTRSVRRLRGFRPPRLTLAVAAFSLWLTFAVSLAGCFIASVGYQSIHTAEAIAQNCHSDGAAPPMCVFAASQKTNVVLIGPKQLSRAIVSFFDDGGRGMATRPIDASPGPCLTTIGEQPDICLRDESIALELEAELRRIASARNSS